MPTPRPADPTTFFTYQNPEAYAPDWCGFYERAAAERPQLLATTTNHTGLLYGDSPYHIANVYCPDHPAADTPLIVYLHGGRWREGHPDYYDVLAPAWLERGAVFASVGYRVEPEHAIADGVDDAIAAVRWAIAHAAEFGANPDRIVLAGHSAGAHLAAMAALTDWAEDREYLDHLSAVLCFSGPMVLRDLIPDYPDAARLSSALRISQVPAPVLIAHGNPEPNKKDSPDDLLTRSSRRLAEALAWFGEPATLVEIPNVDHLRTATDFGDPSSLIFAAAQRMVFGRV